MSVEFESDVVATILSFDVSRGEKILVRAFPGADFANYARDFAVVLIAPRSFLEIVVFRVDLVVRFVVFDGTRVFGLGANDARTQKGYNSVISMRAHSGIRIKNANPIKRAST